jgi:hypothetical protein
MDLCYTNYPLILKRLFQQFPRLKRYGMISHPLLAVNGSVGVEMGQFEGTPQSCYLSEHTQECFKNLYESLEKDVYQHLFAEIPKEEEEKKVEVPSKLQQLIDNDQYDL